MLLVSGFFNRFVEPLGVLVLGNFAVLDEGNDDKSQKESDCTEEEHKVVVLVEKTDDKSAKNGTCYRRGERCGVIITGESTDKFSSADGKNER